jgi:hypothetical protein
LLFANGYAGRLTDAPYFSNSETLTERWRMAAADVDGEAAIVRCTWVLPAATLSLSPPAPRSAT